MEDLKIGDMVQDNEFMLCNAVVEGISHLHVIVKEKTSIPARIKYTIEEAKQHLRIKE